MITLEKLKIYEAFNGDSDLFARAGTKQQQAIMASDFTAISRIIEDVWLVSGNLTSDEYREHSEETIRANCDDEKTVEQLKKLAEKIRLQK